MAVAYSASSVTAKDGAATADFVVKRTGTATELNASTYVSYSTEDNSAKAGTDYIATSGSLDFAAGATEQTISVGIIQEAYESKATLTFLLNLEHFGSYTGSIVPSTSGENKQAYLYIPEDNTQTRVPTADDPGDNLQHQAAYNDLSDPTEGNTQLNRPMAYFRLGYAQSDLNYYERVVLNTDTYHPIWANDDDANPVEPGAMEDFMLPRAINRTKEDVSADEKNNKHLDGILIYSDKNYNVTVGGQASMVVQGDYIQEVEGSGRINWKNSKREWVYSPPDTLCVANGTTTIDGIASTYDMGWARNLSVKWEIQFTYSFAAKYTASAAVDLAISNAAKYSVSNSIALDVKGLQVSATCDLFGNFQVTTPVGDVMTTQGDAGLSASDKITLAIQPATSALLRGMIAGAAAGNAAAAAAVTSTAAGVTFVKGGQYSYQSATPSGLEDGYGKLMASGLPDTCAALSAVTATILIGAAVMQKKAEKVPTGPKIEMTERGITFSVGPQSRIELTASGVEIAAPTVNVQTAGVFDVTSTGELSLTAPAGMSFETAELAIASPQTRMTGDLNCPTIDALFVAATNVEAA